MTDFAHDDVRRFRDAQEPIGMGDVTDVADVTLPEGGALLRDIRAFISRFVALPDTHCEVAAVLWVLHCWLIDLLDHTPRLAFMSPEPGSGKSRALEVLQLLCPRPMLSVNISAAALYRSVSDSTTRPTILFDEIDSVFGGRNASYNEDLRALLNSGYRRGARVLRVADPALNTMHAFGTFAPVAFAGLDRLPDTLASRSIIVNMRRRLPTEVVESFRPGKVEEEAQSLKDRVSEALREVDTVPLPEDLDAVGIRDRDADVWEPLIAVADLLDPHWGKLAREAAVAFVQGREPAVTESTRLLHDIKGVFDRSAVDQMSSHDLVDALGAMEESNWGGEGAWTQFTHRALARLLRPYGIRPVQMRRDGQPNARGYRRIDFEDAWLRYLPTPS